MEVVPTLEMAIATLADFAEAAGLPAAAVPELVNVLQEQELFELSKQKSRMQRCAGRAGNRALPLMDEGHEFGRVEARIPKEMFFHLAQQKNFGWEGLTSDEGMADILKAFPQCRMETVSGKIVSGYSGPKRTVVKKY